MSSWRLICAGLTDVPHVPVELTQMTSAGTFTTTEHVTYTEVVSSRGNHWKIICPQCDVGSFRLSESSARELADFVKNNPSIAPGGVLSSVTLHGLLRRMRKIRVRAHQNSAGVVGNQPKEFTVHRDPPFYDTDKEEQ